MVADLVFFVLGAWVGAGCAVVLISLLTAGSEAGPRRHPDRVSVDKFSDAL